MINDYSWILQPGDSNGGLIQAGCLPPQFDWVIDGHSVRMVVNMTPECPTPQIPDGKVHLRMPIHDADFQSEWEKPLWAVAASVYIALQQKETVVVHCGAGLNRASLVTGLTLTYFGLTGTDAVAWIKWHRPGALSNESFASWLETQGNG